jgi:mRNA interferase MazF
VVVLTREQALGYLTKVTVAPISSTVHDVPSEVVLDESDGMKGLCAVNLFNVMTLSSDLIGRRVAQLSPQRMAEICTALNFALGCDAQTGE